MFLTIEKKPFGRQFETLISDYIGTISEARRMIKKSRRMEPLASYRIVYNGMVVSEIKGA